jgi:hypothetical protein
MKVNLVNLKIILLLFFAVLMVWYLADSQIVEMYKYQGFNELSFDLNLFYSLLFIVVLFSCFFKCNQKSPQYILIGILLCYSYIWFFVFFSVAGYSNIKFIFWAGFIYLLPVILLVLTEKYLKINYRFKISKHGLIKLRVEFVITVILLLVFMAMFAKMNINFSYLDLYERRFLGREQVTGLLGYVFQMSSNCFAPILSFLAIYNKNYKYLFFAFAFVIFASYGFIGLKAPFALVVLMSFIGYCFLKRFYNIVYFLVSIMTILIFLGLLEFFLFDFSWIADIFIRRASLSTALTQMHYLDFIFAQSNNNYNFLTGNQESKSITYLIGQIYSKNILANENTISFIVELGQKGFLGYFFNVIFLIFFYGFLQYLDKVYKHKVWMAIATLYAILLLEQSYTVAFVSSGIGLITVLLLMFSHKKNKNIYD